MNLEPRWLSHVDSYACEDMSKPYARKSWVEVDKQGKVK